MSSEELEKLQELLVKAYMSNIMPSVRKEITSVYGAVLNCKENIKV